MPNLLLKIQGMVLPEGVLQRKETAARMKSTR